MNNQIDDVLRRTLTPTEEADGMLNQTILNHLKEDTLMKPYHKKRISTAVLVAILILCFSSITVYAAWKYLTPDEVAEEVNDTKLTDAFLSDGATIINETQTYGDYQVTLLSIVSGENLSDCIHVSNGEIRGNRTYAVVAIERADGTPMPDTSEDAYGQLEFCVSPLVHGYHPTFVNIIGLHGNYADISEDGILYRLISCDDIMVLADHQLYLSVSDTFIPNIECYHFDAATGAITRNEEYEGLNALFQLPLDNTFADAEAATELLEDLVPQKDVSNTETSADDTETVISPAETTDMETSLTEETTEMDPAAELAAILAPIKAFRNQLTRYNLDQYTERLEDTVQIIYPTEDGYLEIKWNTPDGGSGESKIFLSKGYSSMKPGDIHVISSSSSGSLDTLTLCIITRNEDNSYTFAIYLPKEGIEFDSL